MKESSEYKSRRDLGGEFPLWLVEGVIDEHRRTYEAWRQALQSADPEVQDFRGSRVELSESIGPSGIVELQGGKFMAGEDARKYSGLGDLRWSLKSSLVAPTVRSTGGDWPAGLSALKIECAAQRGGGRESLLSRIGRRLGIRATGDVCRWHVSFTNGAPEELAFRRSGDDGVVPALVTDERTRREAMEALDDHLWRIVRTLHYIHEVSSRSLEKPS